MRQHALTRSCKTDIVSKSSPHEHSHSCADSDMTHLPPEAPRKHPRQSRAQATVNAMLDAAAHILVADGYGGFNTNKVAEHAGVSIGSLYQYFPNKVALITALRQRHADQMRALFTSIAADALAAPLNQAVPMLIRAIMAAHTVSPRLHQVLEQEVPRQTQQAEVSDWEIELRQQLQHLLQSHQPALCVKDLGLASLILVRMVDALVHGAITPDPMGIPSDAMESEICTVVLRYLTGQAT